MKELTNKLNFVRGDSDGVYYTDLEMSLRYSVKFDVYNTQEQIATLVTNNRKSITLITDNTQLSFKRKRTWTFHNKFQYSFYRIPDISLATIYIHRPMLLGWFRPTVYNITFDSEGSSYNLIQRSRKEYKYSDADFHYDLISNDEIKCSIINLKKPKCFYNPTTIPLEGFIEFDDSISLEKILCFLQLVNLHIDLEFDI